MSPDKMVKRLKSFKEEKVENNIKKYIPSSSDFSREQDKIIIILFKYHQ